MRLNETLFPIHADTVTSKVEFGDRMKIRRKGSCKTRILLRLIVHYLKITVGGSTDEFLDTPRLTTKILFMSVNTLFLKILWSDLNMILSKESRAFLDLLRGERIYKPPFWEPWFAMIEFFQRHYGDPEKIENKIRMAQDLGMAAVNLGFIDINASFRKDELTSSGSKRYAGGSLTSLKQLEERELPDWGSLIRRWGNDQKIVREAGLISWITLPWCFHAVATSMGHKNFFIKVYRDPEFIEKAFDWIEERNRRAINAVIREVKPDFVLFDGDCADKHGLMVNPKVFRSLVYERTRETVSHLKHLNIPYIFHSDGKLDDLIPILVELEFSAVHGCEKNANDLEYLVNEFGDDIVLSGNMDVVFLSTASPKEVYRETERMLRVGGSKGKFIAACNTSPQDYVPEENYLAMVEAIKNFDPLKSKN